MTTAEDFCTRDEANEGVVLELRTRTGQPSDKWLRILGSDSDRFREAEITIKRAHAPRIAALQTPEEKAKAELGVKRELLSVLVTDWNFTDELGPCTPANVAAFFLRAPQIEDQVNTFAGSAALFFAVRSLDSSPTPSGAGK